MTYAGLTTADKGALMEAKARGAEWVARDSEDQANELMAYYCKPKKHSELGVWLVDQDDILRSSIFLSVNDMPFVQWSDAEPVNIDLALAQIAEMESAEKPHKCEYCAKLSKYAGWGYAEWFEQTAVDEQYEISVDVKFCPNCGKPIAGPYTEGATDEG